MTPIKINGVHLNSYKVWRCMLQRCYDASCQAKHPTYIGCSVCDEWHLFSVFKEWYDANSVDGWQLDKDLLFVGNKVYSPDTCIFVPNRINSLMNNVAASRGEYPIGVCLKKSSGKFGASISSADGKRVHLGYFSSPEAAHLAWVRAKRQIIIDLKPEMDKIDVRLFPSIIGRYQLPNPL